MWAAHLPRTIPAMDAQAFSQRFDELLEARDFTAAHALVAVALRIEATAVIARYARGVLAMFERDFALADKEMQAVLSVDPHYGQAHHNRGAIAQWQQDYHASVAHFRRAHALDPGSGSTAVSLAHSLLALGQYDEGWNYFEHRAGGLNQDPRPRGLWNGTPLPGRALAVVGEEGIGDVLQFVRYLPAIRERVGKLYLLLDGQFASLAPLLASLSEVDAIVTDRKTGPAINAYCPIMSLAHIAQASLSNPGAAPYLSAPADRVAAWRARLHESTATLASSPASAKQSPRIKRVGLVWGGNPRKSATAADIDSRRSIDPALLAPLAEVPGIEWHTLQLGAAAKQMSRLSPAFAVHDLTASIGDFADTAAYISNLDLVITVDTSVAHVAGAIGAPVWMLNRFDTCWRWGANTSGSKTPWYPSMRIFRQPVFGDWQSVVAEAGHALSVWSKTVENNA
jgi:tetratricopeptide (TPR) repeat protein